MDKKKLLLVAVSVGIFLMIVIGLSIVLFLPKRNAALVASQGGPVFTPSNNAISPSPPVSPAEPSEGAAPVQPEPASRTEPASVNAVDMLRNPEGIQSLQNPPAASTMTQENNIYIYGEPVKPKRVVEQTSSTNSSGLVIEVPVPPPAVAVPSSAPTGRALPRDTPGVSAPAPTSAPKKTAPPASQPVRQPPVSKTPAPVPQPQRVDYWVQAGSFSELNRAKSAQETLAAKGITAIIETKDVQGKNFHRVRVGPYTSQKEADYWLSVMKKLAGFEESLILQSAAPR